MSNSITAIGGQTLTGATGATGQTAAAQSSLASDPKRLAKLRSAAHEFEAVLVKQLLKSAKMGSSGDAEKSNGYGDMAVDAMASAVEKGGGLGLAKRIEQAIGATHPQAPPLAHVAPEKG
jgi:Rod binding domain-containing protein